MKCAFFFAALAGVVVGMLIPGRDSLALYLIVLATAGVWRYGFDWSTLQPRPILSEIERLEAENARLDSVIDEASR